MRDDNPLIGHKADNAIVVAENRSRDLLARAGGADMVLQGLFADLGLPGQAAAKARIGH